MRALRFEEPGEFVTTLLVPEDPSDAVILAALGIVHGAPDCSGKARAIERLKAQDEPAIMFACEILSRATKGGP